jgi:hypothetical protein
MTVGERVFVVYLDESRQNRYRHRNVWDHGEVTEFRVQYEALIAGHWRSVVRYDSAHRRPHRDTVHPDGTQTKDWFRGYGNAEVLTIGQTDIWENWSEYRGQYEREMQQ